MDAGADLDPQLALTPVLNSGIETPFDDLRTARIGGSLNIRADYTANYDATAGGTAENYKRMASATEKWRASKGKGMSAPAFFDDSPQKTAADASAGKLTPKGAGAATSGDSTRSHPPGRVEPRTGRLNVKRATGSGN